LLNWSKPEGTIIVWESSGAIRRWSVNIMKALEYIDRLDHSIVRMSAVSAALQKYEDKESFGMKLILHDVEQDLEAVKRDLVERRDSPNRKL